MGLSHIASTRVPYGAAVKVRVRIICDTHTGKRWKGDAVLGRRLIRHQYTHEDMLEIKTAFGSVVVVPRCTVSGQWARYIMGYARFACEKGATAIAKQGICVVLGDIIRT